MENVKKKSGAKISSQHQITIPVIALRAAGLVAGQRVVARADGPGRIVLERADDVLGRYQDLCTGLYENTEEGFDLEHLRNEWD